jgi:hypothetical protein
MTGNCSMSFGRSRSRLSRPLIALNCFCGAASRRSLSPLLRLLASLGYGLCRRRKTDPAESALGLRLQQASRAEHLQRLFKSRCILALQPVVDAAGFASVALAAALRIKRSAGGDTERNSELEVAICAQPVGDQRRDPLAWFLSHLATVRSAT